MTLQFFLVMIFIFIICFVGLSNGLQRDSSTVFHVVISMVFPFYGIAYLIGAGISALMG